MPKAKSSAPIERTKLIRIAVFGFEVKLVLTDSIELSLRKRKMDGCISSLVPFEMVQGLHTYQPQSLTSYIFLPYEHAIHTLVHESYHAIHRLMQTVGAEHENEIMAYHLGYLCDEIAGFVCKVGSERDAEVKRAEARKRRAKEKAKRLKSATT